ncbi:MAG: type II toxin-antitoxin system prevent-host-death family antitoxin [Rhodobacteraceae bacterium]|nr:type II toxin-antitoxin system prevent-host-death family antitoxin [Paracoccaceae bacterium]MCY4141955.1 type II toxin-antitoxin system prevent-host-death family antitoxin [Paracoccaceae bacterium]
MDQITDHLWLVSEQEKIVNVALTDAKAQLTELVRRAEAGDDIVLTRHGHPVVRLTPVKNRQSRKQRRRILNDLRALGAKKAKPGSEAARSQDFLYNDLGHPE